MSHIQPAQVHEHLSRHLLVDGFPFVVDLVNSRGSWLVDAATGDRYLDLYTFFASSPLGINPPELADDPEFVELLGRVSLSKPANSDTYTTHLAEFVDVFARVLGDPNLPHLFFIEGGALAVENALKAAFDWKSRHNEMNGRDPALGTKVLHLTQAFHGRSGYTMSLTNTDPRKTDRFPKFAWPRIETPRVIFPLEQHLAEVEEAEQRALDQAMAAFERHPYDIACFIAEPIQAEGGDNHMRAEFLQSMQELCREHDALFVLDEVQTGVGLTGTAWAYQQMGLAPDLVAFGKKVQLGGVMAGGRIDEVPDNVFEVSSRINSTWGGGLTDMVRSRRILEVIEADDLIAHAAQVGAWFGAELQAMAAEFDVVANPRDRGLMTAFDLPTPAQRDALLQSLLREERVIALPCGVSTVRFRPALNVSEEDLKVGLEAVAKALARLPA